MELKAVMILMMMVGNTAVTTERIDFDSELGCRAASTLIWGKYREYLEWSGDPDKFPAPQSNVPSPMPGVTAPSIPVPVVYCVQVP